MIICVFFLIILRKKYNLGTSLMPTIPTDTNSKLTKNDNINLGIRKTNS